MSVARHRKEGGGETIDEETHEKRVMQMMNATRKRGKQSGSGKLREQHTLIEEGTGKQIEITVKEKYSRRQQKQKKRGGVR